MTVLTPSSSFFYPVTVAFSEGHVNPLPLIRPVLPSKTIAGSLFRAAIHSELSRNSVSSHYSELSNPTAFFSPKLYLKLSVSNFLSFCGPSKYMSPFVSLSFSFVFHPNNSVSVPITKENTGE